MSDFLYVALGILWRVLFCGVIALVFIGGCWIDTSERRAYRNRGNQP